MAALMAPGSSSGASASPHRVAMCRVLLPDYSCFGIPLPYDCAASINATDYLRGCSQELKRSLPPTRPPLARVESMRMRWDRDGVQ